MELHYKGVSRLQSFRFSCVIKPRIFGLNEFSALWAGVKLEQVTKPRKIGLNRFSALRADIESEQFMKPRKID